MKKIFLLLMLAFMSIANAQDEKIEWMSIEEAVEANKEEPRKLIIDVYTDWCGWCKRMDQTTFSNPVIARYVNKNYYPVKFNAEQKDSLNFKGQTFKYVKQGRRGYHELAAVLLNGKMSYPNIVYMNKDLQIIQAIPGYHGAKDFEKIIKYFGEDQFTEQSFEDYKKAFVSEL